MVFKFGSFYDKMIKNDGEGEILLKKDFLHKTIAISGSTGGLGKALCYHIAERGGNILMLDRNEQKASLLKAELLEKFPNINIDFLRLDLEDFSDVKSVAEALKSSPPDYLILNAGAYSIPRHKTSLGFDNVFQINYLSPYYLSRQLLPQIREKGGRIVAVGSIAHNYSKTDDNDIDFSKQTRASRVYGNAKRRLMFSLFSLESENITVAHPGISFTGITAHYPKLVFAIIKYPMKIIFMKPKRASLSILKGLYESPEGNRWIGPRFFGIWGRPKTKALKTCDQAEQGRINAVSERLYSNLLSQ
ncbi:MAG: SDR family NAD(P)-dependent oxidoreductase [Ruminococcaceae bacterium]|nr:SDR family NAD(P)-dependent oxidoreductase [Oscillospiraceae bacterium]